MSLRDIERAILLELHRIPGRERLRLKDIHEWSTSEDVVRRNLLDDEEMVHVEGGLNCWCAIPKIRAKE